MNAVFPPGAASPGAFGPPPARLVEEQILAPAPRLPASAAFAIAALVFGSLFTGLPYLPAGLGELSGEGALPGFGLLVMFVVLSGVAFDARGGRALLAFAPLAAAVIASFVANHDEIGQAHFIGREGGEKFFNSLLVLVFYLGGFYAAFTLAAVYGVRLVLRCASKVAVVAAILLVANMTVEVVGWFVPPVHAVWSAARVLWCFQQFAPPFRIVGFAPEPSFGAMSALGLLGLMGCAVALRRDDGEPASRWRTPLILGGLIMAFELMANARTFLVGTAGLGLAAVMVGPARRLPPFLRSAALVLTPLAVQAAMIWAIGRAGAEHRTVSNITRTVGMLTATELWSGHPVLGVGLGQYAFHFRSLVPSWGLQSWEISRYFRYDQANLIEGMPPSFSLFTRLGAELGVVGFLAWILPALYAIRRTMIYAPGPLSGVLICAFTAQIWTGLSLDSFRNTYYWIWLACLLAWPDQRRLELEDAEFAPPAAPDPRFGRSWS